MNKRKILGLGLLGGDRNYQLAQGLLTSAGTVFSSFESSETWTGSGSGSIAANTTAGQHRTGTQSIKIQAPTSGIETMKRTISWVSGGAPPARLRVSFYSHSADPRTEITYIRVYMGDQATVAPNGFYAARAMYINPGWNVWDIYPEEWAMAGTEVWGTEITLQIYLSAKSGYAPAVSFDEILLNPVMRPAAMICIVDEYIHTHENAYHYMNSRGLRGSWYVTSSAMNGSEGLTDADLVEMSGAGWTIGNFAETYQNLSLLSLADCTAQYTMCQAYLHGIGLPTAGIHAGHMYTYTETVRQAAVAAGILSIAGGIQTYPNCTADSNFTLGYTIGLADTVSTLAQKKAAVDLAYSTGRVVMFTGNKVQDPVLDGYTCNTADFYALIEYIRDYDMPFLTVADYYAAQSGPINVRR